MLFSSVRKRHLEPDRDYSVTTQKLKVELPHHGLKSKSSVLARGQITHTREEERERGRERNEGRRKKRMLRRKMRWRWRHSGRRR